MNLGNLKQGLSRRQCRHCSHSTEIASKVRIETTKNCGILDQDHRTVSGAFCTKGSATRRRTSNVRVQFWKVCGRVLGLLGFLDMGCCCFSLLCFFFFSAQGSANKSFRKPSRKSSTSLPVDGNPHPPFFHTTSFDGDGTHMAPVMFLRQAQAIPKSRVALTMPRAICSQPEHLFRDKTTKRNSWHKHYTQQKKWRVHNRSFLVASDFLFSQQHGFAVWFFYNICHCAVAFYPASTTARQRPQLLDQYNDDLDLPFLPCSFSEVADARAL